MPAMAVGTAMIPAHALIFRMSSLSASEVRASEADVAYLLESANAFFPGAHLTREDVVSAWAGEQRAVLQELGVTSVLPKPLRGQQLRDLIEGKSARTAP